MSSSFCVLAFALPEAEPGSVVDERLAHVRAYLQPLFRTSLREEIVSDGQTGLAVWTPEDRAIDWPTFLARDGEAIAWLHVPNAGDEASPWSLATAILDGDHDPARLAVPFGLIRRRPGSIEVVTDLMAAVRLFQFDFPSGQRIWTSRQGAAHVFTGIEPRRSPAAWSGMATIGWAPTGTTQIEGGRHLPQASRIVARTANRQVTVNNDSYFATWFANARKAPCPDPAAQVRGMRSVMETAHRWPREAVADLSGGKDSRTIAALGIASGVVRSVRTVETDHGEVETARQLIRLLDHEVRHTITPAAAAIVDDTPFRERLLGRHRATEGRYLAASALSAPMFAGFATASRARFNGLGGEVLAGGALWSGAWRKRMLAAPPDKAIDRLDRFVRASPASETARVATTDLLRLHTHWVDDLGLTTAGEVLDLVYMCDRMPHWVNIFSTANTLCPFFASELLAVAAHSVGAPSNGFSLHEDLLREVMPPWAEVPFYKPHGFSRAAAPLIWQTEEWPALEATLRETAGFCDRWDPALVTDALDRIKVGSGAKREQALIGRVLWDLTFDDYLRELSPRCQRTREAVEFVRTHGRRGRTA